jgi:hypothetical protein
VTRLISVTQRVCNAPFYCNGCPLRRGAINTVQLNYLESYRPVRKRGDKKCTIM